MTDPHPAATASPAEPAKLPSPHRPVRHNEWTRAKMVAFLRELAASQSVAQAAKSVGFSRQSVYKLRTRLQGTPFALAWEVALEAGMQQLAHALMDRALNGEEVPHYYRGELVGTSRRYDNRLAAWLLDNPWKVGRQQMAREFSAEGWDALLERIEWADLRWEDGETLPGAQWPHEERPGEDRQDKFIGRSWYAALAEEELARGPRGGVRKS